MAMPMWCACNLKNIEPLQLIMIIQSWLYFTLKLYTINTVYDENNFLKKNKNKYHHSLQSFYITLQSCSRPPCQSWTRPDKILIDVGSRK